MRAAPSTAIVSPPMHARILCFSPPVVRFFVAIFSLGLGCILDRFRPLLSNSKKYCDEMTILDQRGTYPLNKL